MLLTKRTKRMLKIMNRSGERKFTLDALKTLCNSDDALDIEYAAKLLEANGFLDIEYARYPGHAKLSIMTMTLTEEGVKYREVLRRRRLDYFADKWIDIVAVIISLVSLGLALLPLLRAVGQ